VLREVLASQAQADHQDSTVSVNAQACIRALQTEALFEVMSEMMDANADQRDIDLESVCLQLSRFGCPEVDVAEMKEQLDQLAIRVHKLVISTQNVNELTLLMCLNNVFFEEDEFRGATKNYYSPEHSYLAHVLRTKRGIPLSLSLVYMLVAERVGIDVEGIGMPLHFLVYHPVLNVFIDTFNQGSFLSGEDCEKFVRQSGFSFQESMLTRSTNMVIVQRLLRNLVYAHNKNNQTWEAVTLQQTLDKVMRL
jgi:regulator of sirC expression with transglutaminase-like and TPR domain